MDKKNDSLHKCLLELSGTIDDMLTNGSPQILDFLEDWTRTHYQKLHLGKENRDKIILKGIDKNELREDALFIFDSAFNIICYSGTQNFFSGTVSDSAKDFNLLDIIEEQDKDKLQFLYSQAVAKGKNVTVDLRTKDNLNIFNQCTLEIDMVSSNPSNDRYVGKLRHSEILTSQLLEYQALILDNLPGMDIYLFDTEFNYLFAGGREKERFNLSNVQFIGSSMFSVLESKSVRLIYPFVAKALQGVKNEGEIRYKDDIYFLKAVPVTDLKQKTIAALLFSQNITSDKELEAQLKKGREEALKADRMKSLFIANISHEIRTPLSAIIGFTEQLQKTNLKSDQEKFVKLINKSSDHLLYLVSEIVYLFKLGMGKVHLEHSPFSLKDILKELNDVFKKEASAKNLILDIHCAGELPEKLIGDSFRIRQILINLLSNAIKYTDRGGVSLQCTIKKETKKRVDVLFKVSDTGVGISKPDQKIIFNVFKQGNKLNSGSKKGGAGLGLGICKSLTELLNGTITVKSKLDAGSIFSVALPIEKPGRDVILPRARIEYNLEADNNLLAGKKILLADDDEHNLILADHILKGWNSDFLLVDNGQKAIDAMKRQKFDILLIDIHMPVKNGLDVIIWLRSDVAEVNYTTPALFITANVFKNDLNEYLKSGYDDYLLKPFREKELYNKLCNILIDSPVSDEVILSGALPATDLLEKDLFNTEDLLLKANGNCSFFKKMINNFISNALSLKELLLKYPEPNNRKAIGEKAHKSIPAFKYFGLTHLAGQLEIIEEKTLRSIDLNETEKVVKRVIPLIDDAIKQAKASL